MYGQHNGPHTGPLMDPHTGTRHEPRTEPRNGTRRTLPGPTPELAPEIVPQTARETAPEAAPDLPPAPPPRAVRILPLADREATLARATGSADARVQGWLVNDLAISLNMPPSPAGPARGDTGSLAPEDRVYAAVSALCDIAPRDTLEGMLAAQMVAVHSAATDCLRRAADGDAVDRMRHTDLRHAARLLNVFERQLRLRDDRRNPAARRGGGGRFRAAPGEGGGDICGDGPGGLPAGGMPAGGMR